MKRWLWLVLLAIYSPAVWAADLALDDFAYGIRIPVPQKTALAAMGLPEAVYTGAVRSDLGDVRVFNADGEPVPHMLRHARTQSSEAPWQPLVFFPLPDEINPGAGGYRIYVHTGPDGAVARVDPAPGATQPNRTVLVDLSHTRSDLAQLRLEWQPMATSLMAAFAVDASDDLVHWTLIHPRAAISDVAYGGHRLHSDTILLTQPAKQYLRLRQLDSGPTVALTRIEGRMQPEGQHPVRVFLKIDGRPIPGSPGAFEYDTAGAFPVDRVNLIFSQANSMAAGTLASRNDPQAAWTHRFKGLFYRIDVDQSPLTSAPQPVSVSVDRYWRLTVDASDATMGNRAPRLEIGYRPHDLLFIARGRVPFTLAFGSAAAGPLNVNVAALFDGIGRNREDRLEQRVAPQGLPITLGGPQRRLPLPGPLPLRRIMLWSVLVAGVLIVAAMAWRLARRLKPS